MQHFSQIVPRVCTSVLFIIIIKCKDRAKKATLITCAPKLFKSRRVCKTSIRIFFLPTNLLSNDDFFLSDYFRLGYIYEFCSSNEFII